MMEEGRFVDPYTNKLVNSSFWAANEPNNWGVGEDCTELDDGLNLNDLGCGKKKCVSCSIKRNPQFELRGFCSSDQIDIKGNIHFHLSSEINHQLLSTRWF